MTIRCIFVVCFTSLAKCAFSETCSGGAGSSSQSVAVNLMQMKRSASQVTTFEPQPVVQTYTVLDGSTNPRINGSRLVHVELDGVAELVRYTHHQRAHAEALLASAVLGRDVRLARVATWATRALAADVESFEAEHWELFNPSLVEMPSAWRAPGEAWLVVLRHQNRGINFFSSTTLLGVLDHHMRPTRALRVIGSRDFFGEGSWDCYVPAAADQTLPFSEAALLLGVEDLRLFSIGDRVLLFFTARRHQQTLARCDPGVCQRMHVAELTAELRPVNVREITVKDAHEKEEVAGEIKEGNLPVAGRMSLKEKNWAPFLYTPADTPDAPPAVYLVYSCDPHVVVRLNMSNGSIDEFWRSRSPAFSTWAHRMDAPSVHGGVGPVLLPNWHGKPEVFLSILHHIDKTHGRSYLSYFYVFDREPPFTILSVAEVPVPLLGGTDWDEAFATSMIWSEGENGTELWIMYGSGDVESHRLVLPVDELEAFLPSNNTAKWTRSDIQQKVSSMDDLARNFRITTDDVQESGEELRWSEHALITDPALEHDELDIVVDSPEEATWRNRLTLARRAAAELHDWATETTISRIERETPADFQLDRLFSPSLVELPPAMRQGDGRWLCAFREVSRTRAVASSVFSASLVLAVLDSSFRPLLPVRRVTSRDVIGERFECQSQDTNQTWLGPREAKLFAREDHVMLLFSHHPGMSSPGVPCSTVQHALWLATVDRHLNILAPRPVLVPGEEGKARLAEATVFSADLDRLPHMGTNWSVFLSREVLLEKGQDALPKTSLSSRSMLETSVEPHVVFELDVDGRQLASRASRSSSVEVQKWIASHQSEDVSVLGVQGGVGAVLVEAWSDRPKVFVSVLHAVVNETVNASASALACRSYMYAFTSSPPFNVLGVGDVEIPLNRSLCALDSSVTFSMTLVESEKEIWVVYGAQHAESRRFILPVAEVPTYLPPAPSPGFTLVVMTHSVERFNVTKQILTMYRQYSNLDEIVVIWNNENLTGADELRTLALDAGVPLRVVPASVNSMNNRFAIWDTLETDGVIVQDDDMWVDEDGLGCMIDAWKRTPELLVGVSDERTHFERDSANRPVELAPKCVPSAKGDGTMECDFWGDDYSMVLPHPWVLSRKYLQLYMESHVLPVLVDDMFNCDDIALNAIVANFTRAPPLLLDVPVYRADIWKTDAALWSSDKEWKLHRTQCMERVRDFFGAEPPCHETGTVFRRGALPAESCPRLVEGR